MSEKGKLIGIGINPENELTNPEALKILETIPVIYSQRLPEKNEGIALDMIEPILQKRKDYKRIMVIEPVYPLLKKEEDLEKYWTSASSLIANYLDSGRDVAFITLDDESIASTLGRVEKALKDDYEVEIISDFLCRRGKLIGIGVGPGDTELLTLKAAKLLEEIQVICSPKSSKDKESIALSIVDPIIREREDYDELTILEPLFPMIENKKKLEKYWDDASQAIADYLNKGIDVAFITLGDPSIFSTFSYVQKRLKDNYTVKVIPGITSFTACASACDIPLVEKNQVLTVVPKIDDRLEDIMSYSDSIVLMKTSRNPEELEKLIESKNKATIIYSVENCTRDEEKVIEGFSKDKPYLTTTLVKFID